MQFLLWFDDSKKSAAEKIQAAVEAWFLRYGVRPTKVLVNEADRGVQVEGMEIVVQPWMRKDNFGVL